MRPKIKKTNTKKRKQKRKDAQASLQKQTAAFLNHPRECCVCKTVFERTAETVKSWHVVVNDTVVRLTCPKCWNIIMEAMENQE
jgi:hypothetical protein